jgi:hypothetical protein
MGAWMRIQVSLHSNNGADNRRNNSMRQTRHTKDISNNGQHRDRIQEAGQQVTAVVHRQMRSEDEGEGD